MQDVYAVLLAGGVGERLWPLSRSSHPKQFLSLGNKTLFEDTLNRIESLDKNLNIWCVTLKKYQKKIDRYNGRIHHVLYEPIAKNTAPAILLACLRIHQQNPSAVALFLPTDHVIFQTRIFRSEVKAIIHYAHTSNNIILLGVEPKYPATEYGYIRFVHSNNTIKKVEQFFEKPTSEKAKNYYEDQNMLWNIGIVCARIDVLIGAFKKTSPQLFEAVNNFTKKKNGYERVPSISFDHAVLEKWNACSVLPAHFSWSDVGDLSSFLSLRTLKNSKVFSINAPNNLVHSNKKIVALAGVTNLCIVETNDTLLILPKDKAQEIKNVLACIKKKTHLRKML